MKKKTATIVCIVLLLFGFAVYNKDFFYRASAADNLSIENETLQESSVTTLDSVSEKANNGFRIATIPEVVAYGSGNDKAFFELHLNDDGSYRICSTNYREKTQSYICTDSNCDHSNMDCSARIEAFPGIVFPVALNERLVLVYSSNSRPDEAFVPSKIEAMDLDGTNRRIVCTFPENVRIAVGAATDEENIVVVIHKTERSENEVSIIHSLLKINTVTGEQTELYSVAAQPDDLIKSFFLRGTTDDGFVLKTITTKQYEECDNFKEMEENCRQATTHEVFLLPYDNSSVKPLLSYKQDDCFEKVYSNQVIYLKNENEKYVLKTIETGTGEERTIVDDFSKHEMQSIQDRPFRDTFITGFVGNHVLLNHLYEEHQLDNGSLELLYKQFAIDLNTGESKEIKYSNYYSLATHPLIILAENDGELLTYKDIEETDCETVFRKGMITVEDYLDSIDSFEMVD